jgi:hypothetical protein
VFWAKIAAFAVVGLLSILPTIAIFKWRKQAKPPTRPSSPPPPKSRKVRQGDGLGVDGVRPDPDLRRRHGARLRPLDPSGDPAAGRLWRAAPEQKGKPDLKIYG